MGNKNSSLDHLIEEAKRELSSLDAERARLVEQISSMKSQLEAVEGEPKDVETLVSSSLVTSVSPPNEKIALFRSLFRGRQDVFPQRFESAKTGRSGYQPACKNEWIAGLCRKPKAKCSDCGHRELIPVSDELISCHLRGAVPSKPHKEFCIGVYPMLLDETCWLLAADFDKASWADDCIAFLRTCKKFGVPAALERSRSGEGGHIWIFFAETVPAITARRMGTFLLTETMEQRPEIGLDSYDRFFPSQDTLPQGGFGSLIALPLQGRPRQNKNSVFLDVDLSPYSDQWAFLASVRRMGRKEVESIAKEAERLGRVVGVRVAVPEEEEREPWELPPSGRWAGPNIEGPYPENLVLVLGNQVYLPKAELSPALRNRLIRIAAFQNPEFYKAQAMRFPTFDKPRVIGCCEDFTDYLGLPRGCLEEVVELLDSLGIDTTIKDERFPGEVINVRFKGQLRGEQERAAAAMLAHDTGVLSASTAFGKTVVACYLVAQRRVNTLVAVHRRQLLDQWVARLSSFLGLIGQIGGGKKKVSGIVDVALVQSLGRKGVVKDLVGEYGHLVVDECHHISARSFEIVARQCKARYVTGLSATVTRRDGHHPIIFMQCGPVRYRVSDRKQARKRPFRHRVIVRVTSTNFPELEEEKTPGIHLIYSALTSDAERNRMIVDDVLRAARAGRSPIVLTERREHLSLLRDRLASQTQNVFELKGGLGRKERRILARKLLELPEEESRVIIATGRYIGEGFDDARLDTLFLALPVSWKGTLSQYAGRLHRLHHSKKEVLVYDYADLNIPVLARMYERRRRGYTAIGYEIESPIVHPF